MFLEKNATQLRHMNDYTHYPPYKYFSRVIKSCPKSALLYIQLWHARGKFMTLEIDKETIRKRFLVSPTLFRNLIIPLAYLNIISYEEHDKHYVIQLMGPIADV